MSSLVSFLRESQSSFSKTLEAGRPIRVVIGNEASDLDSIASSISFAFFLHCSNPSDPVVVPLMNIPRADFVLRTETAWLFKELQIPVDALIFFPEVEEQLDVAQKRNNLQVILVDHNRMAASQEKYEKVVTQIVDHHKDEERSPQVKGELRNIEVVGSAATLVAEKEIQSGYKLSKIEAKLLLSPILLDTVNLDPKHKKVTPKDSAMAAELIKVLEYDQKSADLLYDQLKTERFSVDSLSSYDLLRMDYKQFTMGKYEVGISSAKKELKSWLSSDPNIVQSFEKWSKERKLDILFAMTVWMDDKENIFRELIVFTSHKELMTKSKDILLQSDLKMELVEAQKSQELSKGGYAVLCFVQHNTAASRKQLQPLLVTHLG